MWGLRKVPLWHWGLAMLVLGSFFVLKVSQIGRGKEPTWLLPLWIGVFGSMAYNLLVASSLDRPGRDLARRLRFRSNARACPVLMTVLVDDVPVGQSEGLAIFEDGALRFEGEATAFRLNRADVVAPREAFADGPLIRNEDSKWRFGNWGDGSAWGFLLEERPDVRVNFFPLKAKGFPSIYKPLFEWLREEPEGREGTVLPPLVPQRGFKFPGLTQKSRMTKLSP